MGVNVDHRTFVIKRALPGSPAHAFRFWSDRALKRQWNACHPDWHVLEDRFDFRVDGCERLVWRMPQGIVQEMTAHFLEIAERQRIVYAYTMRTDGRSFSSSLVTVEFESTPTGTEMTFTEQACLQMSSTQREEKVAQALDLIGCTRLWKLPRLGDGPELPLLVQYGLLSCNFCFYLRIIAVA